MHLIIQDLVYMSANANRDEQNDLCDEVRVSSDDQVGRVFDTHRTHGIASEFQQSQDKWMKFKLTSARYTPPC